MEDNFYSFKAAENEEQKVKQEGNQMLSQRNVCDVITLQYTWDLGFSDQFSVVLMICLFGGYELSQLLYLMYTNLFASALHGIACVQFGALHLFCLYYFLCAIVVMYESSWCFSVLLWTNDLEVGFQFTVEKAQNILKINLYK